MFTFEATPTMFVGLLVLFGWCTVWSAYELTRPQDGRQRVSNGLHLAMSVVMLLMVAGPTWQALSGVVPTPALVGLFAVATGWFGWLAVAAGRMSDRGGLRHFLGHTAMFAAMTWHLAAMAVMAASTMFGGSGEGPGHSSGHEHGGGMEMGDWMTIASQPGGVLWWFAMIGLPLMAYLLAAALRALWLAAKPASAKASDLDDCDCADGHPRHAAALAHSCHEVRPAGSVTFRLAALSGFAMNGGMFWMSVGLMTPLLPIFAHLSI